MPGNEVIGYEELSEIENVFNNGGVLFRHGFDNLRGSTYKVQEFEDNFAKYHNSKYALAVSSGTAALRVALASLGIEDGDEVITQSFTFVATVEAIIESGAKPVCTEIDETLNMDPSDLLQLITDKTKAVIVVHMLGYAARLDKIKQICDERNITLIEDTAWGCGGRFNGKSLGTWGDIGAFSFDYAKTITTGEGGMLLFNDQKHFLAAKAWHDHGHENNPAVPRWEDTRASSGFNFRMMELQGAVGVAQLRKLDDIVKAQRTNAKLLWAAISDIPGVVPRFSPEGSYETFDALVFFVQNEKVARECRKQLLKIGLGTKILPEATSWHFAAEWSHIKELVENDASALFNKFPVSTKLLKRAVSIPVGVNMPNIDLKSLHEAIVSACNLGSD